MKKRLALFLVLLLSFVPVLTSVNVQAEEANEDVSGHILVWEHATDFEEPLVKIIDEFKKVYPNVDVEYEIKSSNYYNLLTTAIQSGDAPDLFWTNGTSTTEMFNFIEQDKILDITDLVDLSALPEPSLSIGIVDGKQYSVPWMSYDTRACYYNKDIFAELDLEIPETFTEFEELLPVLQENGYIPISLSGTSSWALLFFFEPLLAAYQPEYTRGLADYSVKANDPVVGETLEKALEWADKGYFGNEFLGVDSDGQNLAFTMGKAAMNINGSWSTQSFAENNPDLNFGAFQIPTEDGIRGMVGTYANGFSIYQDTDNQDAALAFAQFCGTIEAQDIWVNTLGSVSGSPDIEVENEVAAEISIADETYVSWQSILAKYNKEDHSATSIWDEDSTKVFSKAITIEDFLSSIGEAMQ